jgi:hypothetical protein
MAEGDEISNDIIEIPQTQWYQFLDRFTSIDELLRVMIQQLAKISTGIPIQLPPPAEVPVTMEEKLSAMVSLLQQVRDAVNPTSKILTDKKTLTTSAQRMMDQGQVTRALIVKSSRTNTGTVYVGERGVKADNGLSLAAGQSHAMDHDNSKDNLYAFSTVDGDTLEIMLIR